MSVPSCSPYRVASAHPDRVDRQADMPAPVESWPRAHRGAHAAHQHPDVGRLDVGTDRPRAPGPLDQLSGDRDQLVLLGLRVRPRRLAGARDRVLDAGVLGGRLRVAAQEILDQRERLAVLLERLARPLGEQPELLRGRAPPAAPPWWGSAGRRCPRRRPRGARRRRSAPPRRYSANAARALSRIRSRLRRASARSGRSVSLERVLVTAIPLRLA